MYNFIHKNELESQKEIIAMTTDSTKKQHISSNQNEELAPVVEESNQDIEQDIEELNETDLDTVAGGLRCPSNPAADDAYTGRRTTMPR